MELGNYCISTMTPFSNNIIVDNLKKMKKRVTKKNLASVLLIDGGLGKGKTTTAVQIASFFQGSPIDLKKQLALGGGELMDKLMICNKEKLPVLIYDEASDFNRRGALSKFNADMNRVFDVCRSFKVIIILVLPCIVALDKDILNKGIVRLLIHVADKSVNYNLCWVYSAYRASYLLRDLRDTKKTPVIGKAYTKTHPNFDFRTYNLTKERAKELERFSTESKKKVLQTKVFSNNGLLNSKQLAEALGMSKQWVSLTVGKHNIACKVLHNKVKYFDADVLTTLKGYVKNKRNVEPGKPESYT